MKLAIGFLISFIVGAACRYFDLPAPAPGALVGALLVTTTTVGFVAMDYWLK